MGMISAERAKSSHKRNSRRGLLASRPRREASPAEFDRSGRTKRALFKLSATATNEGASPT